MPDVADYEVQYLNKHWPSVSTRPLTSVHLRGATVLNKHWLLSLHAGECKVAYAYLPLHLTKEQAQAQGEALMALENVRQG